MREILFRAKAAHTIDHEWLYGYVCVDSYLPEAIMIISESEDGSVGGETAIAETVGQFTGLTDKNGKQIFEGDICRNTKNGEIVSVKWHGTMAGFVWSKRKEKSHLFDFGELFRAFDKYEVIGNIHDNPELLEDQ